VSFIALAIAVVAGLFNNPYAGLVVSVVVPALLVFGLLLIPLGMWLEHRKLRRNPNAGGWPVLDFGRPRVRRVSLFLLAVADVNLVIVLVAGYGSLHWMESPSFCGEVCHTPMRPQFEAWSAGPHARTACVQCHVGEGPRAFVRAKLAGVRQLAHVITGSYARPIPAGAELPDGVQAQLCASCHVAGRTDNDAVRTIREYNEDEANTETTTVLQMNIVGGSVPRRAIHWHADPSVRVEYVSTDKTNETIPYVKVTDAQGRVTEFVVSGTTEEAIRTGRRRTMDCIDCHNNVGHPIEASAERAVDDAIASAQVSRTLPFVRREGVRLLKASYSSAEEADAGIDRELRGFYQSRGGPVDEQAVAQTVSALQRLYRRSVFPEMKVSWGSYPSNRGHLTATGCFRCHDDSHVTKDGKTISADCEYCHTQQSAPAVSETSASLRKPDTPAPGS
jgi:nitrate/TMAO reductase-like tetraheme cytochrome c subunit